MSSVDAEFSTVDLILQSSADSRGVDAFCLAWIKFERQMRKLTGNLLYQASVFDKDDKILRARLRDALLVRQRLTYTNFWGAIHRLSGENAKTILSERFLYLREAMEQARDVRNKIFHGLQTGRGLGRSDLQKIQGDIRECCRAFADVGRTRFGYDGFAPNSLRKTNRPAITRMADTAIERYGWEVFVQRL